MIKDEGIKPTVSLDREPLNQYEIEIVNGFPQIPSLEAIWVRDVPPQLTNSYPTMRVYLAMSVLDQRNREMADQIQAAFETRYYFDKIEFEFIHIPADRIPKDLPSRIWKRARIWTPEEDRRSRR